MKVTRRFFGGGIVAFASAGMSSRRLVASDLPTGARLEAELTGQLARNPTRAVFTVPVFGTDVEPATGGVRMTAQVRLDWAPGFRSRQFVAAAESSEAAYVRLRSAAFRAFEGVVPGFDAAEKAV